MAQSGDSAEPSEVQAAHSRQEVPATTARFIGNHRRLCCSTNGSSLFLPVKGSAYGERIQSQIEAVLTWRLEARSLDDLPSPG